MFYYEPSNHHLLLLVIERVGEFRHAVFIIMHSINAKILKLMSNKNNVYILTK